MTLLEIGSVRTGAVSPDAVTVDCAPGADHLAQWGVDPLPVEDASFDEVYASHTLEHVPWFNTQKALSEVFRVLKSGGGFEVWVPNFAYLVDCYQKKRCGDKWRRFNKQNNPMLWVNGRIFTYGPGEENWHRAVFDEAHLHECLASAGFVEITRIPQRTRGISHGPIDLGMLARKP